MNFIKVVLISLALSTAVFAQSPTKVLKDAEKAMGGERAIRAVRQTTISGTVKRSSDNSDGRFSMRLSKPNRFNIEYNLATYRREIGSNGRSGWLNDTTGGLRTLTGQASNDFQAMAAFQNALWLDLKKERAKIASGGTAMVNGRAANVVLVTTAKNVSFKLYFDKASALLVRDEFPFGETRSVTTYSDHRKVDGVMTPFAFTRSTGDDELAFSVDTVDNKANVDVAMFDFPKSAGDPLPDIQKLLSELQLNEDKVEGILDTYSYVQKVTSRSVGKDGVVKETGSETNQLSFYKGNRIRRTVEKNGKPLSEKDQEKEDKEVQKRVDEIEKKLAEKEEKGGPPDERSRRVSIAEVLRASRLINPRRERMRGRDVIVFDFEPNPAFDYNNAKSMLKFFGKTAGVMWIDEKDKQVARLEAFLADSFNVGGGVVAKLRKGASFVIEQERVNDEIWLPATADINMSIRVLLVKGIDINQVVKSYDYKKFATEVEGAKVGDKP